MAKYLRLKSDGFLYAYHPDLAKQRDSSGNLVFDVVDTGVNPNQPIFKLSEGLVKQKLLAHFPKSYARSQKVMAVPPTVTTGAVATLTTGLHYNVIGSNNLSFASPGQQTGPVSVGGRSLSAADVTADRAVQKTNNTGFFVFDFDGTSFELEFAGTLTGFKVKVDDEYVSLTGLNTGAGGTSFFAKYVFAGRTKGRITVLGRNLAFRGLYTDATARITPAPLRGPKVAFVGDSFGQAGPDSYVEAIHDILGWDNLWSFAIGGTGWVNNNNGNSFNWVERMGDVANAGPFDAVWYVGSVNDYGSAPSTVAAQIVAGSNIIKAAMPDAVQLISPTASKGVGSWYSNMINVIKQMAQTALAQGIVWASPLELPLGYTGTWSSVIHNACFAGGTQVLIRDTNVGNSAGDSAFPEGATVEILDGNSTERVQVKSMQMVGWTGTANVSDLMWYINTVSPLQYNHAGGGVIPVSLVPSPYITGTGRVGATTGVGNSDVYCGTDGTHPSNDGQFALALGLVEAAYFSLMS